jgi:H+/Cl- antiporter ClcA
MLYIAIIAGLILGVMGLVYPEALGLGYDFITKQSQPN